MIRFRWFILRLLFSLLALPIVAFIVLWLLHEIVFPNAEIHDLPVVVVLWLVLFGIADLVLRRSGMMRYDFLQEHAQMALNTNPPDDLEEIHQLTRKLFSSGYFSQSMVARLQRDARRQFLSFYENDLGAPEALAELRLALREGHRREEIYGLLKNHLLSQPVLTMSLIDLAEELLEYKPDDAQLLDHLIRTFIDSGARHHRAEYFYRRDLEQNGPFTPAIVSLCLENLFIKNRHDDFALWAYVRAFEAGETGNPTLRRLLFQAFRQQQPIRRSDRLTDAVAHIAATFSPEEFSLPPVIKERRELSGANVLAQVRQGLRLAGEKLAGIYSALRPRVKEIYVRHRLYVWIGAGVLVFILGLRMLLVKQPNAQPPPAAVEQEENLAGYFALQVGAWKKPRSAEQERQRLQNAGLRVRVLEPRSSAGWYRIHVGRYATRKAAQAAADSLKRRGVIEDFFITEYQNK